MNRSFRTWLVFGACMALGLAGLVWISRMVVGLERREAQARGLAAQEERIRLALWRMDSALAPLVAQESSRPYFHFRARYPANAAYAHMYDRPAPGSTMLPSPLLGGETPQVKLHFQVDPAGRFSSPQVPEAGVAVAPERLAEARARLEELSRSLSREHLLARMTAQQEEPKRVQQAPKQPERPLAKAKAERVAQPSRSLAELPPQKAPAVVQQAEEKAKELEAKGQIEAARTVSEFAARARQQAASNEMAIQQNVAPSAQLTGEPKRAAKSSLAKVDGFTDSRRSIPGAAAAGALAAPPAAPAQVAKLAAADQAPAGGRDEAAKVPAEKPPAASAVVEVVASADSLSALEAKAEKPALTGPFTPARKLHPAFDVQETPFKPYWVGEHLLLARSVTMADGEYLQGCWLDWNAIQESLRKAVLDLLPDAAFEPAAAGVLEEPGRLLAALPVRLQPGPVAALKAGGLSPAILALLVGWACALVSGIAATLLLQQALELGERRGAFVSAVTHELRTPLTTFRMYAELLHLDMVKEESERRALLETLVVESDRLDHLVKNVLSYARLESGRDTASLKPVPVAELLERGCERLSQRAAQAGMRVELQVPEELAEVTAQTDPSVVEQILFNLVDNACKYAAAGVEQRIHIKAAREHGRLALRVQDHGPGIARADRRKLFRPFHKSAREAARSAPGVGLGLALCRMLAINLGGDLRLDDRIESGACFVLELPLTQDGH